MATNRTYTRFEKLACFVEVLARIKRGDTPTEIADFIQKEQMEYIDIKRDSLAKIIGDYSRDKHPQIAEDRTHVRMLHELQLEECTHLDVLQKFTTLALIQERRVGINVSAEITGQRLIKGTREEIKTYAMVLGQVSEHQDRLNGTQKTMRHIHEVHQAGALEGQKAAQTLPNTLKDPGRRQLILQTLEQANKLTRKGHDRPEVLDVDDTIIDAEYVEEAVIDDAAHEDDHGD